MSQALPLCGLAGLCAMGLARTPLLAWLTPKPWPLAGIVSIHTQRDRGCEKQRALPKNTQLQGCSLDSHQVSTSQGCVLNHWACRWAADLWDFLVKTIVMAAGLSSLAVMLPKGPAAHVQKCNLPLFRRPHFFLRTWAHPTG